MRLRLATWVGLITRRFEWHIPFPTEAIGIKNLSRELILNLDLSSELSLAIKLQLRTILWSECWVHVPRPSSLGPLPVLVKRQGQRTNDQLTRFVYLSCFCIQSPCFAISCISVSCVPAQADLFIMLAVKQPAQQCCLHCNDPDQIRPDQGLQNPPHLQHLSHFDVSFRVHLLLHIFESHLMHLA